MLEIIHKVDALVKKFNMLSYGDFVVIGVSGGADSMMLLNYFLNKREKMNLKLLVANVEHGIRGKESVDDTEFVKKYCQENNVDFESVSIDAVALAKSKGLSVEEFSRDFRYNYFKSFKPDKIATAHNLSDNVETVLFRLSRGTSINGCCGIPARRNNIIRPLLNCTSEEIRNACRAAGIPYRLDSTNNSDEYSRNYIRHNIVPEFKELNPSFESVFMRFINSCSDDNEALNVYSDELFHKSFNEENNSINLCSLLCANKALVKRAIIKYFNYNGIMLDELHLTGIYNILSNPGKYQIKNNIFAVSDGKLLRIAHFNKKKPVSELNLVKKTISFEEYLNNCELFKEKFDFFCDCDKICGDVGIRSRLEGDKISPAGRSCSKTLKKLFNELKINIEDREYTPVLYDDIGIIGIYGYCCDERARISNGTNKVLMLKISPEEKY